MKDKEERMKKITITMTTMKRLQQKKKADGKINEEQDEMKRSYSYAILDVMTTSAQHYDDILYVPVARRIDSIPQSVSDHYPIALE